MRFMQCGQLEVLKHEIPTAEPRLDAGVYELVLDHFLAHSTPSFLDTIKLWGRQSPAFPGAHLPQASPSPAEEELYSIPKTMQRIADHMESVGPAAKARPVPRAGTGGAFAAARRYDDAIDCFSARRRWTKAAARERKEETGMAGRTTTSKRRRRRRIRR